VRPLSAFAALLASLLLLLPGRRCLADGGCEDDAECDDGDVCTLDRCVSGTCEIEPIAECCVVDADCEDGVGCSVDRCDPSTHRCESLPPDDCCLPSSCDDGDRCTMDRCDPTIGCLYEPIAGCGDAGPSRSDAGGLVVPPREDASVAARDGGRAAMDAGEPMPASAPGVDAGDAIGPAGGGCRVVAPPPPASFPGWLVWVAIGALRRRAAGR